MRNRKFSINWNSKETFLSNLILAIIIGTPIILGQFVVIKAIYDNTPKQIFINVISTFVLGISGFFIVITTLAVILAYVTKKQLKQAKQDIINDLREKCC